MEQFMGHNIFESILSHKLPFPLQCRRLTRPWCRSRKKPSRLSPLRHVQLIPSMLHSFHMSQANTRRSGGGGGRGGVVAILMNLAELLFAAEAGAEYTPRVHEAEAGAGR
ncbi:E3 ubiquitin-protein ligase [Sesbania bispinosa]|nr:E3 ubiquitin-protein ligase [Sesbania bispinosa]